MATATKTTPTLAKSNSHTVREELVGRHDGIGKEEVFLYFRAEWRGQPCRVVMHLDRYRANVWNEDNHTSTTELTKWRAFAERAEGYDPDSPKTYQRGADLSDLARRRLSDEILPLALAWLETDAYTKSEEIAYARMILDTRNNERDGAVTREMRRQCEQYRDKLPTGIRSKLLRLADNYEMLALTRENISAELESLRNA